MKLPTLLLVFFCLADLEGAWAAERRVLEATGPQPTVVSPQGRVYKLYEESNALLISVSKYTSWRPLPDTEKELDQLAELLRRHGFRVTRLKDPTGDELSREILDFKARYGWTKDSRVLVMFSGHGFTNPNTKMGYLVPVDAPNPKEKVADFYRAALGIRQLELVAQELESRHALFLFDSCFSGSIFARRSEIAAPQSRGTTSDERWRFLTGRSKEPIRQFISAGDADQELPAKSVFLPLLLRALSGDATKTSDGYVTGKEIGLWLEQNVPSFNPQQTPRSDLIRDPALVIGDMIFQAQPQAPVAGPVGGPAAAPPANTPPGAAPATVAIAPPTASTQGRIPLPAAPVIEKVTFAADGFFDVSKAALRPDAKEKLDAMAEKAGGISLEVVIAVGHTDAQEATNDVNRRKLSIDRAEAVKNYLASKGIDRNRVYTEGKGATQPVASNASAEGRAKNRRVEVEVVGTRRKQAS